MNGLGYLLLSLLVRKPYSGYELQKLTELFWQAKHSQIYPLLAEMERKRLATFEVVGQSGKPDKKIYTITDEGKAQLQRWIARQPYAEPVLRDEFLVKVYAVGLIEPDTAVRLFEERHASLAQAAARMEGELRKLEEQYGADPAGLPPEQLGLSLICRRMLALDREELRWCETAMELFHRRGSLEEAESGGEPPNGTGGGYANGR